MGVYFVLLAHSASFDEFVDIGSQSQPPEVSFKEGFGVESTGMSKGRGRVKGGYEGVTSIQWNIHSALEVKMTPFVCPVFYRRTRE